MPRLFCSGGLILDNVVMADGALARGQIGGNALYSAAGAALWLGPVGVAGRVPAGYPLDRLQASHHGRLDLSGVRREAAVVTLEEWFFYGADAERQDQLHASPAEADAFGMTGARVAPAKAAAFASHLADRPAQGLGFGEFRRAHPVLPATVPPAFWAAEAVHLAPNPVAAQIALAQAASERGLLITCDPGHFGAGCPDGDLDALLGLVDAFVPSAREAAALCPGSSPTEAALALANRTRRMAGVKLGAAGAVIATREGDVHHIPAWPAEALDPTGAGDAWCGGLLAGLVLGESLPDAAMRASVSAAIAVGLRGPEPLMAFSRERAALLLAAARSLPSPSLLSEPNP